MTACMDRAAQFAVQALYGICGVDHFSDFLGIGKKGNHVRPMAAPGRTDGGKFLTPGTVLEFLQRHGSRFGVLGSVDILQLPGDRFAILPGAKIQGITNQVHDAGLNLRLGKYRVDCLRKSLQAIDDGDQNIVHPAVFDLRHHPQPKFRAFRLLDPMPSTSLRPSGVTPIAKYTALLRTVPSSRIFTRSASRNTSAYNGSSGRLCQRPTSSSTASVTVEISCGE